MPSCESCREAGAKVRRPRNGVMLCLPCFFRDFEDEVHQTIVSGKMLSPGDVVACGASGGKDSTVLMHLIDLLNRRHGYGVTIQLVSIDEGIAGYRDHSLDTVHRNARTYNLPLTILSYKDLFGWTMDEVVRVIGSKSNCTYCGVFRRQALERAAVVVKANKVATGHNADDAVETFLMNVLRADIPRLARGSAAVTDGLAVGDDAVLPRVKPLVRCYQKDIVLYAHFKKLDYFVTECTYSKEAFRGDIRRLIKSLEALRPRCIGDALDAADGLCIPPQAAAVPHVATVCKICGHVASQPTCRACSLLASLRLRRGRTIGGSEEAAA